jgi:hypothetical protein
MPWQRSHASLPYLIVARSLKAESSSFLLAIIVNRHFSEGTSFPVHVSYSCLPTRKAELAIYPATFRMA